jgi:AraC-like DNA-binding protein
MRYSPPPEHLGDRISSLYEMYKEGTLFDEIERADRPQLRIMLSGQGIYEFPGGAQDPAHMITLIGPTSGPVRSYGEGPVHVVGAGLLPPAWVTLLGGAAERWIDRALDARDLFGTRAEHLRRDILAAPTIEDRFVVLCAFVEEMTRATDPDQIAFTRMVDNWLIESIDPQVETLVARSGLSMRQLERQAKRYYGLPPKTLARKYRALRVAAALARGENLNETGLTDSFYDQSHLIREVKRFAGLTPKQIGSAALQSGVARGRGRLKGKVGPLVSDM